MTPFACRLARGSVPASRNSVVDARLNRISALILVSGRGWRGRENVRRELRGRESALGVGVSASVVVAGRRRLDCGRLAVVNVRDSGARFLRLMRCGSVRPLSAPAREQQCGAHDRLR